MQQQGATSTTPDTTPTTTTSSGEKKGGDGEEVLEKRCNALHQFAFDAFSSSTTTAPSISVPTPDTAGEGGAEVSKHKRDLLRSFIVTHAFFETSEYEALKLWIEE